MSDAADLARRVLDDDSLFLRLDTRTLAQAVLDKEARIAELEIGIRKYQEMYEAGYSHVERELKAERDRYKAALERIWAELEDYNDNKAWEIAKTALEEK